MKRILPALGSLALSLLVAACASDSSDTPPTFDLSLASQLEAEYGAPFAIDSAGSYAFVASPLARSRVVAQSHDEAVAAAKKLFAAHGAAFGAEHEAPSLAEASGEVSNTSVHLTQRVPGTEIEIIGKGAILDLDDDGTLLDAVAAFVDAPKLERPVTTTEADIERKISALAASWKLPEASAPEMIGKPRLTATPKDGRLEISWRAVFRIDLQGFAVSFDPYTLELLEVDTPRGSIEGHPSSSLAKGVFSYLPAQAIDPTAKTTLLPVETTVNGDTYVLARNASASASEVATKECSGLSASERSPKANDITSKDNTEFLGQFINSGFKVNAVGLLGPGIAVNVHHNAIAVDKHFRDLFHESPSADGRLVGIIHMNDRFIFHTQGPATYEKGGGAFNAGWDPATNLVGFGDGGYSTKLEAWVKPPGVALDVAAHEWTHAYISRKAKLSLIGEEGAMQEGIADAIGVLIAARAGEKDFVGIGKSVRLDGAYVRNFANPQATKAPTTPIPDPTDPAKTIDMVSTPRHRGKMNGPCAFRGPDQGCVHLNAGPLNYALHLMLSGGIGTDASGPGLPREVRVPAGNLTNIEKVWINSARSAPNVGPVEPVSGEVSFMKVEAMALQQINYARSLGYAKTLVAVGCAWHGTGFVSQQQLRARGITCQTEDTERGAAVQSDCGGKADGYYCSPTSPFSGTLCRGGAIAGGAQCPSGSVCARKSQDSTEARLTSAGAMECEQAQ